MSPLLLLPLKNHGGMTMPILIITVLAGAEVLASPGVLA